jgi:hypothetical protein
MRPMLKFTTMGQSNWSLLSVCNVSLVLIIASNEDMCEFINIIQNIHGISQFLSDSQLNPYIRVPSLNVVELFASNLGAIIFTEGPRFTDEPNRKVPCNGTFLVIVSLHQHLLPQYKVTSSEASNMHC